MGASKFSQCSGIGATTHGTGAPTFKDEGTKSFWSPHFLTNRVVIKLNLTANSSNSWITCLHALLPAPFLLSYRTRFLIFIFSLFFVSGPCARLSWPSRQLLSARKSTVSYHHITSHGEDGCKPHLPLYPRNNYLYKTLLLHK